ncbi:MAG: DUF1289 domain-containing protein [Rubrimonas sp.]|uniref:DUF1289 domain-containing protein n=1 Tax=Rubrimonas sp. TaxID=2036015 RepID=UPI002FDDF9E1
MSASSEGGAAIESPCVNICVIHPGAGLCVGCLRTGDEIARWGAMSPQARRALMAALPARAALLDAAGPPPPPRSRG